MIPLKRRETCIWYEDCTDRICDRCEYYTPPCGEEDYIEDRRAEFEDDWQEYLAYIEDDSV